MSIHQRARRSVRRLTARGRSLPDFIVVGGIRCGTSSFFDWISAHPDVVPSTRKEVHYFDRHYERGEGWYRSFFPRRVSGVVSFEATPSYLAHPLAGERASSVAPDARIIAILRDPVERAWSHYRFRRAGGYESRTFREAIRDELEVDDRHPEGGFSTSLAVPYLVAGRYADQVPAWLDAFGSDGVLLIDADAMFSEPADVLSQVIDFVGVRQMKIPFPRSNTAPSDALDDEMRSELVEYYEPYDRALRDLVDIPFRFLER